MPQMFDTPRFRSVLALLAAAALAVVCTTAGAWAQTPLDVGLSQDDEVEGDGLARFRVVHNSPDAPAVDILVDDTVILAGVPFFTVSDYLTAPAGTYNVKVNAAGTSTTVIEADLALAADTYYTIIARGTLAEIAPTVLVDETATAPAAGNARVRVFHGSPDAPAVDITLTDGTVLVPGLEFPNASGYLEVPAGDYDLQIRVAGTDIVALNLPTLTVEADETYTAYAKGLLADGAADRTLYLHDDRFRIDVSWEDFEGNTGIGLQQGLTNDTGYFYFFDPENVELVIKVLDGTSVNDSFWVFYGSLSNVGYEITATDTETGVTRTFVNPLGEFASFGDVGAFPAN